MYSMGLQVSLSFNGNGREALEFYSSVFKFEMPQCFTYGDSPADPDYPMDDKVKDYIMYTEFKILGVTVMLSDWPPEMEYVYGLNMGLCVVSEDKEELTRLFNALKEGGKVDMPLEKTFWSELYGMVTDKFGIQWQVNFGVDDCGPQEIQ